MSVDPIRELAEKATQGEWWDSSGSASKHPDTLLIALAPDLARVAADLADILRSTIYQVPGYTGPRVWWGEDADVALAAYERLQQRAGDET